MEHSVAEEDLTVMFVPELCLRRAFATSSELKADL